MEIKRIYSVYTTINERGSIGELIGRSYSKEVAEELSKGYGWYGGLGAVLEDFVLLVDDLIYLLKQEEPISQIEIGDDQVFKDSALSKLTDKEKQVLGLSHLT